MAEHSENTNTLTLRGALIGALGMAFITAASLYIALRMGALPWPTVIVTVVSMAALSRAKGSTLGEINTTHTMMSSGAMVAGGLAFTLPGLWMVNPAAEFPVWKMAALTSGAVILGTVFTVFFRRTLIVRRGLTYPMGVVAKETLIAGTSGGKSAKTLFSSMGFSAVFTVIRDAFKWIPAVFAPFAGNSLFPGFSLWVSPMALGIGAMIAPVLAFMWFGASLVSYYIFTPVSVALGWFENIAAADAVRSNFGIGIMIGTGLGVFLRAVILKIRTLSKGKTTASTAVRGGFFDSEFNRKDFKIAAVLVIAAFLILLFGTDFGFVETLTVLLGVLLMTYLSSTLTGETGINPMEVFAIMVLFAVRALSPNSSLAVLFSAAAVTAVACGLAGDVMNDFKSGYLLKNNHRSQAAAELLGSLLGGVIAVVMFSVFRERYSFGSAEFPAPQAAAVASMAGGLSSVPAFVAGLVIGAILSVFNLPTATLGLGIYLPVYISAAIGIGALIGLPMKNAEKKNLISAGLLGGEGVAGAFISLFS